MEKKVKDYSILGIMCFFISGFLIFAWIPFMLWEIEKAPIVIEPFIQISGLIGGMSFGLLALGIKLIK